MVTRKKLGKMWLAYLDYGHPSMLWLYRILFIPALLLGTPFYLARMRRRGGYRENFSQRFGTLNSLPAKSAHKRRIWLQAVSVGEMLAIEPILRAWQADESIEVYLTTTTSTGYQLARESYCELTIGIGYFPLDWGPFSSRAWKRLQPDLVILTEGERWPEHIHQASKRGVPVIAVNARLSDRSFDRMMRFRAMVSPLLRGITHVLACSPQDAERFRELGVPDRKITETGNIKLDVEITRIDDDSKARLKRELGLAEGYLVLMGSSTWPGEEIALVRALQKLRANGVACNLLLVPRHAERRNEIEAELRHCCLTMNFRSRQHAATPVDIAVGDTTGEMRSFLQLADVIFVGKSLPPHTEGQTPVESGVLGKPILFGPEMGNFRAIARDLVDSGAAMIVGDETELINKSSTLMTDENRREQMADAARNWHQRNLGAVERAIKMISGVLESQ